MVIKLEITNEVDFYVLEKSIRNFKHEIERSIERGEKSILNTENFAPDQISFEQQCLTRDKQRIESISKFYNQLLKSNN